MDNIARQSARGGLFMLAGRAVQAGVSVAAMIVLARLLAVSDFGLFAMAVVVVSFFLAVNTLGIGPGIVQRPYLTRGVCQRIFGVSVVGNLILVGILLGLGPIMAWFFDQPRVSPLMWGLGVGLFVNGISAVPDGLARREMKFGPLSGVDVIAVSVSSGGAIVAAWAGWGPWALVIQMAGLQVLRGLGRWLVAGWWPGLSETRGEQFFDRGLGLDQAGPQSLGGEIEEQVQEQVRDEAWQASGEDRRHVAGGYSPSDPGGNEPTGSGSDGQCEFAGDQRLVWSAEVRPGSSHGRDAGNSGARALIRYGGHFSVAKLIRQAGQNLDQLLIGVVAGAGPLGLYSASFRWAEFPVKQIHVPFMSVCVSAFSRLQDDPRRLGHYVRQSFLILYSLLLPVMGFLFVEAPEVIRLLLGEKWLAAVAIFQWLVVALAGHVPLLLTKYLYYSDGRTDRQAKWSVIQAVVLIAGSAGGAGLGVWWWSKPVLIAEAVAVGHALGAWSLLIPAVRYCAAGSSVHVRDQLWPIGRPGLAMLGAVIVTTTAQRYALSMHFVRALCLGALVFAGVYSVLWLVVPGGMHEAKSLWRLRRSLGKPRESKANSPDHQPSGAGAPELSGSSSS